MTSTIEYSPLTTEEQTNLAAVADVLPFWNTQDVEGVLSFYDPDITWHNVALNETYRGKAEVREFLTGMFTAFPDLSFDVGRRIARGDLIAEEWTIRGTHRGQFIGIPATGRRIEINGVSMNQMRDAHFLQDQFYFDAAAVLRQLRLLPSLATSRGAAGRAALWLMVRRRAVLAGTAVVLLAGRLARRRISAEAAV